MFHWIKSLFVHGCKMRAIYDCCRASRGGRGGFYVIGGNGDGDDNGNGGRVDQRAKAFEWFLSMRRVILYIPYINDIHSLDNID